MRLLEVIGPLSLATDLGNGQPLETALRCALLGAALSRIHGFAAEEVDAAFWAGILRFGGCIATSFEEASFTGDDLDLRRVLMGVDLGDPDDTVARLTRDLSRGAPDDERRRQREDFFARGSALAPVAMTAHCEVAMRLATRLGLGDGVIASLGAYHERWDGSGSKGLRGEAIPPSARALAVAQTLVAAVGVGGEVRAILGRRAGGALQPGLVNAVLSHPSELLPILSAPSVWERALADEPHPIRELGPSLLEAARVLGDFANVKSPYTLGHSQGTARIAVLAGQRANLDAASLEKLEIAALLHDLGRVAVPNGIWDRKGPLGAMELERVRDHALHTGRILSFSVAFRDVAEIAAADHERVDGSGYPRRVTGVGVSLEARILAAADVYHALIEERPHRAAHTPAAARQIVDAEVKAGRLDRAAAGHVLEAAGHVPRARPSWPAGLSQREVEVLRLVTRGQTNKEVAAVLGISPRTVQQHTLNIYGKIGVSTRAAAALFASEHDLLGSN